MPTPGQADELEDVARAAGLKQVAIPELDSEELSKAQSSKLHYRVSIDEGLKISPFSRVSEPQKWLEQQVGDKLYVGINEGEFGGGVYIRSPNFGDRRIVSCNPVAFIYDDPSLYIFEGLAHMFTHSGSVRVISDAASPQPPNRITLLPDTPQAVLKLDGRYPKFVIVGYHSLMTLRLAVEDLEDLLVVHQLPTFWSGLTPNSIVSLDKEYVIGMRSGVVAVSIGIPPTRVKLRYFQGDPQKAKGDLRLPE